MPPDQTVIYYTYDTSTSVRLYYSLNEVRFPYAWNANSVPVVNVPRRAQPCTRCGKELDGKPVERFGGVYHQRCFARVVREGKFP